MTRLALVLLSLISTGCIDFDAIGLDRCANTPGLCGDGGHIGFCGPCTSRNDCEGTASLCIREPGGGVCGRDCNNSSCGADETCTSVLKDGVLQGKNCIPKTLCDGGVRDGG